MSKHFNDPASVRNKTRQKIQQAILISGFRPNLFAVNLKRQRSKILGVIAPDGVDPFFMKLTRRIKEIARHAGSFAIVLCSNGRAALEVEAIGRFQSMNVAGAIMAPLGQDTGRTKLDGLASRGPVIWVDIPGHDGAPHVGTDNTQSMGLIMDDLCRSGEPPCFPSMPKVNGNAMVRRMAYQAAILRAGYDPMLLSLADIKTWNFKLFGHQQMTKHLSRSLPLSTVLCANDRLAFGALLAA